MLNANSIKNKLILADGSFLIMIGQINSTDGAIGKRTNDDLSVCSKFYLTTPESIISLFEKAFFLTILSGTFQTRDLIKQTPVLSSRQ